VHSSAVTCPIVLNAASLSRWGSSATTCSAASNIVSLLRRAPNLSRRAPAPGVSVSLFCGGGGGGSFGSAIRPTVPCGSHGSGVKKDLVGLAMGLVSRVLKAHSCIFKAPTSEQLWSTRRADRQHH
jgi:hypothetical protein